MGNATSSRASDLSHTSRKNVVQHAAPVACLLIAGTLSGVARAAEDAAPAAMDEIIVTATRRSESLDKTPLSISAYTQGSMDEQGIKEIDDVARFTPGLNFAPAGDGLTNAIAIRGIASGVGASTTGLYIDDTPIQVRSGTGIVTENAYPQIFDLQRVEVLRGPQGTLFGTGSMGGTVRFITPEPDLHTYSGYARAEYGSTRHGDGTYEVGAALGGPIIDGALGFRASAFYSDAGGWVNRQPFDGTAVTQKGVNFDKTVVLRTSMKWALGDSLTITPAVTYQSKHRDDGFFWLSLSNPDQSDFNTGYTLPQLSTDSFTLPSLNVHWSLSGFDVISNTSFFYRVLQRDSDYSNFLWNALVGDPTPSPPLPGYRTASLDHVRQNSFTQELRLQSTNVDSPLQWVAGVLFQSSRLYTNQYEDDPQLPALSLAAYGAPIEDVFGEGLVAGRYSATIDQWATDKQAAVFGQVDYTFVPGLKGTLGVRVARTTLDFHRNFGGPLLCVACNGTTETTGGSTPANKPVTPRVGLSYEPNQDNLYYASASKGYRVGGVNNPSVPTDRPGCPAGLAVPDTYSPDSLWSYELGAKNHFGGGHLRTQASVYYIDWKNIQQSVSSTGCLTASYKANLGQADVRGFELGVEWQVTDAFNLALSGGYSRARYTTTAFGAPAAGTGIRDVIARDGDSLGVAPWNATLSGEYRFDVLSHSAYLRADYTYTARDTAMTPNRDPSTSIYDPDLRADDAIRLLGARLGMRFGGVDLSVFGRNLLNDAPILGRYHDNLGDPLYYAATIRPRTIGITGTYKF